MKYLFSLISFFCFFAAMAQNNGDKFVLYRGGPVMEFTPGTTGYSGESCAPDKNAICVTNLAIFEFLPDGGSFSYTQNTWFAKCNGGDQYGVTYAGKTTALTNTVYSATVNHRQRKESHWWKKTCVVGCWAHDQCGSVAVIGSFTVQVVEPVNLNPLDNIRTICKDHDPIDLRNYLTDPSRGTIYLNGAELPGGILDPSILTHGIHNIRVEHQYSNGRYVSSTQSINIILPPSVSAGEDKALCKDHGLYYLSGTPSAGTWSGQQIENNTFDTKNFNVGKYKLTYSKTDQYGCTGSDDVEITVNALPNAVNNIQSTFCLKDKNFDLKTVTPKDNNLECVWSGAGVQGFTFYPSLAGIGEWTISLEVTNKITKCKSVSTKTVVVKGNPNMFAGQPIEVCAGADPIKISGDLPSGGVYKGTGVNSATGTFDPNGLVANSYPVTYTVTQDGCNAEIERVVVINPLPELSIKQQTITVCPETNNVLLDNVQPTGGYYVNQYMSSENVFSIADAKEGIHPITYHYIDKNKCINNTTFNVSIVPKVTVDAGPDFVTCEQDPELKISGQYPEGGLWSATCGSCVSDYFDSKVAGAGTYTLTYKVNYGANCNGLDQRKVTVKPNPIVNTAELIHICKNDNPINLDEFATPEGGKWTVTAFLRNNTFYPAQAKTGYNQIKYTYTDPTTQCSTTENLNVNVNNVPVVNAGPNIFTCLNSNPVELSGDPIDGTWSGKGVNGKLFDAKKANIGANTLYLQKSNTNGCTSKDSIIAMVYELPVVDAGNDEKICKNAVPINLFGSPTGGSWVGSDAIDINNYFDPAFATSNLSTLTYTYTDPNGCTSFDRKLITILPTPIVRAMENNSVCESSLKLSPKGGSPIGGTWLGNGVVQNNFYPAITGSGNHPIFYVFSDLNGCTDSAMAYVEVLPSPTVQAGFDTVLCKNTESYDMTKFSAYPSGGKWTGANIVNNIIFPSALQTGRFTLYYTVTDLNKCSNIDSVSVDVEQGLETPIISGENQLCQGDTVELEAAISTEDIDTKYFWYKQGETQPFTDGKRILFINEKSITVFAEAITPKKKCPSTKGKLDMINDTPTGSISAVKTSVEQGSIVKFNFSGVASSYKWNFGDDEYSIEPNPAHYYYQSGVFSVKVDVTSQKGCKASFEAKNLITVSGGDVIIVTENEENQFYSNLNSIYVNGFPNPVSDIFTLDFSKASRYNIIVSDIAGRILNSSQIIGQSGNVDFTLFPSGYYIMTVKSDNGFYKSFPIEKF